MGIEENLLPAHPYSTVPPAFGETRNYLGRIDIPSEMNQTKYKLPDKALGDRFELRHFPPRSSGQLVSSDPSIAAS